MSDFVLRWKWKKGFQVAAFENDEDDNDHENFAL